MSDEIRLAFSHPSERAAATAPDDGRDRISLRDYTVEVEIGAFQSERGTTQRVKFNVVVEVLPQDQSLDDDVDRILSYDALTDAITAELEAERLNLLETLAERVADRILLEPQAVRVFVRIEKLDRGAGALGVEIVRSKGEKPTGAGVSAAQADLQPVIIYLSNDAMASSNLSGWLDGLAKADTPVVLCVGTPDWDRPRAESALSQRHIDLLAIEQNAWVLAGLDRRCVVVSTRTELEWAMKHGQISVWAPSKLVLDAVDGPAEGVFDGLSLSVWFAGSVNASRLIVVDDAPDTDLPTFARHVPVSSPHLI